MTDKNHLSWTFMFWSYLWFHAHMSYIWAQWQNEEKSIGFRTPGFGKRQEPDGRGWGHHPPTREPCPGSGRLGEHSSGFILSSPSTKWMLCSLWLTGWMLLEFSIIFTEILRTRSKRTAGVKAQIKLVPGEGAALSQQRPRSPLRLFTPQTWRHDEMWDREPWWQL